MEIKARKEVTRLTITLPTDLVKVIDQYVEENFLTRNKWFLDAVSAKMEKDRLRKIDDIVRK
jgi:metal-responsive CopG/Arc/MetJ family transcriptional regulator